MSAAASLQKDAVARSMELEVRRFQALPTNAQLVVTVHYVAKVLPDEVERGHVPFGSAMDDAEFGALVATVQNALMRQLADVARTPPDARAAELDKVLAIKRCVWVMGDSSLRAHVADWYERDAAVARMRAESVERLLDGEVAAAMRHGIPAEVVSVIMTKILNL